MNRIWNKLEQMLNDFSVKKKLLLVFVFCVLIPLFVTDSIILAILLRAEKKEQAYEMANVSSAVKYIIDYSFEEAVDMTNSIYVNKRVNEFLNAKYQSDLEYFESRQDFLRDTFFDMSFSFHESYAIMYADNDSIVNGGHFSRLAPVKKQGWYQYLMDSGRDIVLLFDYTDENTRTVLAQRKISVIRKLNYFKDGGCEKVVKLDLDYNALVRKLTSRKDSMPVYICSGDRILFSNEGHNGYTHDYETLTGKEKIVYEEEMSFYGFPIRILIMEPENMILTQIYRNLPLILFMIAINLFLPWVPVYVINLSFTGRLQELSQAFDQVEAESLKEIENVRGKDEIGSLMENYNRMVRRSQELIKTVYKDRLERQEMDIARQNAELLALHSQINPHFLFNVLENIRMHSILKGEEETADMIERLAILERQNVNWVSDMVEIREEIRFIEAYLELQKYRFGGRLSYEIQMEPECEKYRLPKLTLVTFVENACVHGVENKASPCWVYVRVYRENGWLNLEVEDTGCGMDESQVGELMEKMRESSIDMLRENRHVGIINACVRLKMITNNEVVYELESEKGVGTFMTIRIPADRL